MPTGSDGLTPIVPNPFVPGEYVENPSPFGLVSDPRDPTGASQVPAGPDRLTPMLPDPRHPGFLAPASLSSMLKDKHFDFSAAPLFVQQQQQAQQQQEGGKGKEKGKGKKGGKDKAAAQVFFFTLNIH